MNNCYGYILQEVDSEPINAGFMAERFIPLSEIDETELAEVKESVCA